MKTDPEAPHVAPPMPEAHPPDPALEGSDDPFYIRASSPVTDEQPLVLKQGETFAVFNHFGDIEPAGLGEEGLYHQGTRHLSSMVLRLNGERPLFLSSTVKEDNALLAVDLTNADVRNPDRPPVPRGTLHVLRQRFLWGGACHERIDLRNFGLTTVDGTLSLHVRADFADIFEVRGTRRARRGHLRPVEVAPDAIVIAYDGLDGVARRTRLTFMPAPTAVAEGSARFDFSLAPRATTALHVTIACENTEEGVRPPAFAEALARVEAASAETRSRACSVTSSNDPFNGWIARAVADLDMLRTEQAGGPYPDAGVPWFSTPFGRDGILTALETLWIDPALSRGVLAYLAATQATTENPAQDAEPGKILHETRRGEMAALGEIPFGCYYGSVDATPLFVMLAGAYFERTGDRAFLETLWPHVELALEWIDGWGDLDGDGFVEYQRRTPHGLANQGWKDSEDAVFHADGTLATGPIALCEVQGYVFRAKSAAAAIASAFGQLERSMHLSHEAWSLRERFEKTFWCERLGTYALALDGDKRPCEVRSSNAGQCLYTGIASEAHAMRVAATLMDGDGFSGWGVRTVSAAEARHNPMSYHDGSVWPHDNALIAEGLARYGHKGGALRILSGLYDASLWFDLRRMPELFCGFDRRPGEGPTLYPVACAPQAWAAAAVFSLLRAVLGLEVRGTPPRITFRDPHLPPFLEQLRIADLRVGDAAADLLVRRHGNDVGINVLRREGPIEIVMVK